MNPIGEELRNAMRHWTTGVAIVTSFDGQHRHGMTVNSLTSVSLDPPIVTVTLAHITRTYALVSQSGVAGITILSSGQGVISDRFAGKVPEEQDRFAGLETFTIQTGAAFIRGGAAFLDCRVRATYPLGISTLFLMDVVEARPTEDTAPLVYFNRIYHRLCNEPDSAHK
jgi:flavin reductase (DIM6/NTAB) family NADH-FMN oxidoreductase RutF